MAGRTTSVLYYSAVFLHLILLTSFNNGQRFGLKAKTLHITEDYNSYGYRQPLVINRDEYLDVSETSASRTRRDIPSQISNNDPNITTKVCNYYFLFYHHSDTFNPIRNDNSIDSFAA